jgi:hypothetical protein
VPLAAAGALVAAATYYSFKHSDQTVHAQSEQKKEQDNGKTTIKRRPSWAGPFEGWSDTSPGIEKSLEEALKKIGTSESDANTP